MPGTDRAYLVVAVLMSLVAIGSAIAKLRLDPHVVRVVHDVVGVPMKWFPGLAACELAGGIGLLVGMAWPPIGVAAAAGLVVYFVGAMVAHLRVGDVKGLGAPAFPFFLALACLVTRILSAHAG